jgi:hypothetical protein
LIKNRARAATRYAATRGPRVRTGPPGFVLLAVGLSVSATTSVTSGGVFVAAWMAVAGLGTGIAMATAMSAALVEMPEEKSGVASAVLQAVNKTGGPFGIAILGSVLSADYLARLSLSGLSPAAAAAARQSVFGGVAVRTPREQQRRPAPGWSPRLCRQADPPGIRTPACAHGCERPGPAARTPRRGPAQRVPVPTTAPPRAVEPRPPGPAAGLQS